MTDQVVDCDVLWYPGEGQQKLMRFNWSVSCQLSLVPHLTLSDGVSPLHLHGPKSVGAAHRGGVYVRGSR